MRHQVAGYKLNRTKGARIALRRTLIKQLFKHERITTTRAKAEAIRGEAERMITIARRSKAVDDAGKVHARRLVAARLGTPQMEGEDIVKRLFDEIAPRFENRNGGYTRMLKLGPRQGDAADMVMLELVEE
jgi:large subunit ribosomal protein L17